MRENYKSENSNLWNEIPRTVHSFTYCRFEQPKAPVWYFSEKERAEVRQELAGVMDTSDSD